MPDIKNMQAPYMVRAALEYLYDNFGVGALELPEHEDLSHQANSARCAVLLDVMRAARSYYIQIAIARTHRGEDTRPFEEVAAEAAGRTGYTFELVEQPTGPVSVGEDLQVPGLVLQQVADLQPVRDLIETFGAAVGDLDDSLADLRAKAPGGEPS